MAKTSLGQELLHALSGLGVAFGQENSFKLGPGRLLADRLLVGVNKADLQQDTLRTLAAELGMPPAAWDVLAPLWPQCNAVFFGTEEAGEIGLCKLYLEFWDAVRGRVRAGDTAPQLLHLGVKWTSAAPGHFERARYTCHPLLGARDVLRRMAAVYPPGGGDCAMEPARAIVRQGYQRAPEAAFLYLEVSEADNPRRSFDINVYKASMTVADAADELLAAARNFGVAADAIEAQLLRLGPCPLGHLSGGIDRKGNEFLSVYAELRPLPD